MSEGVLLDTHAWLWLDSDRLSASADVLTHLRVAIEADLLFIASFSLFEVAHKLSRGRLHLGSPFSQWLRAALGPPGPRILDITPQIASAVLQLPEDFHGDPGDRILAAMAITKRLTLYTHDVAMLRFGKQGLYKYRKVSERVPQDA